MDETNSLDNLLGSTELPVTPNSAQDLTIEQQSANIEAKSELVAQAAAPATQRTLSLSQRLMKEKRTAYEIIIDGRVVAVGKVFNTKPKNLIGKKEGTQFVIAGRKYVIKDIQ